MRVFPVIVAIVFLTTNWLFALAEPMIPPWSAKERAELEAAGWVPGAVLLTDFPIPDETPQPAVIPLPLELPLPEEIAEDTKRSAQIPESFLADYFAERPKSFLVDPQGLLSLADARDRASFLMDHSKDSSIDLFVYVIGGQQEIPSAVRQEEVIERFFAVGRPAVIVFYYHGMPQRSVVYLSPSITGTISSVEQHRALESSVNQAFGRTDPSEQLDKFITQLSIRIYWMERMIQGEKPPKKPDADSPEIQLTRQVTAKAVKFQKLRSIAKNLTVPASLLLAAVLAVLGIRKWRNHRRRYHFPEFGVEPRLGGPSGAGIGAVISFASAAVPPASQREQVPDYLRRA